MITEVIVAVSPSFRFDRTISFENAGDDCQGLDAQGKVSLKKAMRSVAGEFMGVCQNDVEMRGPWMDLRCEDILIS
jgi:hypothetical protein